MRLAILALAALALAGCGPLPPDTSRPARSDNPSIDVTRLFEVDGCRVYKFHDGGYDRYFASCPGSTQWTRSSGKSTYRESIETAESQQ